MKKMIQIPCGPSRSGCVVFNGGRSTVGLPRKFGICNLRPRSVCIFCRSFQRDNVCSHNIILSATSNSRKKSGCGVSRSFSTCSVQLFSSTTSLSVLTLRPPSPLVLVACLVPSFAPQLSDEWFALRRDKLTASTFSTALGFWKRERRAELWKEKVFLLPTEFPKSSKHAMEWGMTNEASAIERYKSITGREVASYGFVTHPDENFNWVGASPDGLLGSLPRGGILEVKCPYNKGKPERGFPWDAVPFYYMPQMQGQMEIMNRDWVDLYCWTPNGSTIFRIYRERSYWKLINGILREFWWENVVPAREALSLGNEGDVSSYSPSSTHKLTSLAIAQSKKLSGECKLLCREISGQLEFFR